MKKLAKPLALCLALGLVLAFGSVASAQWQYYSSVTVTTPAATVVRYSSPLGYYTFGSAIYGYPAPIVAVPTLVAPPRLLYRPAVLVSPRARIRPWGYRAVRVLVP
jgi:hypothetical protein